MFLLNNLGSSRTFHSEKFAAYSHQSPAIFDLDGKQIRTQKGCYPKKNEVWNELKRGSLVCVVDESRDIVEVQIVDEIGNDEVPNTSILRAKVVARFVDVMEYRLALRNVDFQHLYITSSFAFMPGTNIVNLGSAFDERLVLAAAGAASDSVTMTLGELKDFLSDLSTDDISADEIIDGLKYFEGHRISIYVNKYERNPAARRKCIEHHGAICKVCEVEMTTRYGEIAQGFVHIHHIKPLFKIGAKYEVDPVSDLVPLCPNCHAAIHFRNPPYSVAELSEIVRHKPTT